MESMKPLFETFGVIRKGLRAAAAWASVSEWRRLFLVSTTLVIVFAGVYASVEVPSHIAMEEVKDHGEQMRLANEGLQYKATLDSIELCINATREKLALRGWYCEHATMMFEQASKRWPPERAAEIVAKHAYGAMKVDVEHYLRSVDLTRLIHTPPTQEQRWLNFLASKIGSAVVVFVLLSIMFAGMYYLSRKPLQGTDRNIAAEQDGR